MNRATKNHKIKSIIEDALALVSVAAFVLTALLICAMFLA